MKKIIAFALLTVLTAACGDTPVEPVADLGITPPPVAEAAVVDMDKWYEDYCYGDPATVGACWEYEGMWHRVNTPSGNTNYFYKEDGTYHFWNFHWWSDYEEAGEWKYDQKIHFKKGQRHVYGWTDRQDYSYTYFGMSYDCSYYVDFHFANGKVTKEVYDFTCTPS